MPDESKKFFNVDAIWKNIMNGAVSKRTVLAATSQPNILLEFNHSNGLLEEIQKGLNDYLEKKRMYFPRFVALFCIFLN